MRHIFNANRSTRFPGFLPYRLIPKSTINFWKLPLYLNCRLYPGYDIYSQLKFRNDWSGICKIRQSLMFFLE